MSLNCSFDAWCLFQCLLKPLNCRNDQEFSYLPPETLMCNFETSSADLALGRLVLLKEAFAHLKCLNL